ncbi:hypothetical protein MRX96_057643 [Rhipicephalus microplus]
MSATKRIAVFDCPAQTRNPRASCFPKAKGERPRGRTPEERHATDHTLHGLPGDDSRVDRGSRLWRKGTLSGVYKCPADLL